MTDDSWELTEEIKDLQLLFRNFIAHLAYVLHLFI